MYMREKREREGELYLNKQFCVGPSLCMYEREREGERERQRGRELYNIIYE